MRAAAVNVLEARGPPALEQDACGQRMGQHLQIRAPHRRPQIGVGGAAAPALAHRHVHAAEAFLLKAVHIVRLRIPRLHTSRQPGRMQGVAHRAVAGLQLAADAAVFVASLLAGLGAPEIRQHIAIGPAGCALCVPAFEILSIAADVHQSIDGRGAAQNFAARRVHAPPIQMRLRFRVVEPIVLFHVHRYGQRRRHLNEDGAIGPSVLQQQHTMPSIRGQPVRKHAARRPRPHDDVIVFLVCQLFNLPVLPFPLSSVPAQSSRTGPPDPAINGGAQRPTSSAS